MPGSTVLMPFVDKLATHTALSQRDRDAILELPHSVVRRAAGRYIFREGDKPAHCAIMLSGYACRHKILADGSRQILAFHIRGDGMDLQNALLVHMDHSIQALTDVQTALVPAEAVRELAAENPAISRAMWIETLIDSSIQREWIVNVGRRDARSRIAHLLCELAIRQEGAGLGTRDLLFLPLTQEQLADATGLSLVHVNRVLKTLASEALLVRERHQVRFPSWPALTQAAQFTPDYLHPVQNTV
jgi:CRP-like cAMP-binding protein